MRSLGCDVDAIPREGYVSHCFTVSKANRALVLVRRVVADVVEGYHRVLELQETLEAVPSGSASPAVQAARAELARTVQRLHTCLEELEYVGVELRDFALGIVDFPCLVDSRHAYLCWRLGERSVRYWHELGEGFAERQPVQTMAAEGIAAAGSSAGSPP